MDGMNPGLTRQKKLRVYPNRVGVSIRKVPPVESFLVVIYCIGCLGRSELLPALRPRRSHLCLRPPRRAPGQLVHRQQPYLCHRVCPPPFSPIPPPMASVPYHDDEGSPSAAALSTLSRAAPSAASSLPLHRARVRSTRTTAA
jgi:hypothetical protein